MKVLMDIVTFLNLTILLCRWTISKTIYFRTLKWLGNQLSLLLVGFQVT